MKAAWLVLLCACSKGGNDKLPPASLNVWRDGKPITMTRSFLSRSGEGVFRLMISDTGGSCEQLVKHIRDHTTETVTLTIEMKRDDRGQHPAITEVATSDALRGLRVSPRVVMGPKAGDVGEETRVEIGKLLEGDAGYAIEGSVNAIGCGDEP